MKKTSELCIIIAVALCTAGTALAADRPSWPATLPVYDHIVIVVEENKDFEQILGRTSDAPYFRKLAAEGATFERMFAEEHFSEGNYFWLFSGSNQNVGFLDQVPSKANHPDYPFKASNLGEQLIKKGLSFKDIRRAYPISARRLISTHRITAPRNAFMRASMSPGSALRIYPTERQSRPRPICDLRTFLEITRCYPRSLSSSPT